LNILISILHLIPRRLFQCPVQAPKMNGSRNRKRCWDISYPFNILNQQYSCSMHGSFQIYEANIPEYAQPDFNGTATKLIYFDRTIIVSFYFFQLILF
jgi:hypothetical protein